MRSSLQTGVAAAGCWSQRDGSKGNRKHGLALLTALLLALPTALNAANAVRSPKPNIVLILADDLGYGSLGCYGNTEIQTPNIDRLAAGGVRFTDFHSNGPVCSPTRAALMTGRYPQRCAWVADEELSPVFREQRKQNLPQRWAWGIATNELTIAELLRQAGYRTGLIGKWHLGYDFKFHPMNYGFDEFRGYVGGNVDYHTHVAGYGLKQLDWWKGEADRERGRLHHGSADQVCHRLHRAEQGQAVLPLPGSRGAARPLAGTRSQQARSPRRKPTRR